VSRLAILTRGVIIGHSIRGARLRWAARVDTMPTATRATGVLSDEADNPRSVPLPLGPALLAVPWVPGTPARVFACFALVINPRLCPLARK